jgi:hypothetical protein
MIPPMFLADTSITSTGPITSVVATLDGVTTVLTAFVFVCLIMPTLVKHRSQFYAALACVAGIIAVHTLTLLFGAFTFGPVVIGGLQLLALLLMVLSVGGLTVRELGDEMARAYEVIRRGETEKETIIPIGDKPAAAPRKATAKGDEPPRKVYKINTPPKSGPIPMDDEDEGIPLS